MRTLSTLAAGCAAALLWAAPASALAVFKVALSGANEVPPVVSPATGAGTLTLLPVGPDYFLAYDILVGDPLDFVGPGGEPEQVVGMHIHAAPAGVNGAVIFNILADDDLSLDPGAPGGTRVTGLWDDADGGDIDVFAAALLATAPGRDTGYYVNVHTAAHPAGEIRGQITATPVPAALGLMGAGLAGLGLMARRRRGG
ncbi:MAG: CHRD domain-containing protein [Pseudomonadota bacterium]